MEDNIYIPGDVPNGSINEYFINYDVATQGSGRLMLFAGDQKIEHLNGDFYGEGIAEDDNEPEHLFKIADAAEGQGTLKPIVQQSLAVSAMEIARFKNGHYIG